MKGDNNDVEDTMSCIPQKKEIIAPEEMFISIEEYYAKTRAKLGTNDKKIIFFRKCPIDIELIKLKQLGDIKTLKNAKGHFQDNCYKLTWYFINVNFLNK